MSWRRVHTPGPTLRTLEGRWHELRGLRVIVRLDLNVPVGRHSEILCDYRLRRAVGLVYLLSRIGCRVIMVSHFGRPRGERDPECSLFQFIRPLARLLEPPVTFLPDCVGPETEAAINNSAPGSIFLLENLRFHPGEEEADPAFAGEFTRFADVFINDAFSVSHRFHASTALLPQLLPSFAGPAFIHEYKRAVRLTESLRPPIVIMSGGMKLDKLAIYRDLMPRIDRLLLGSGFAAPFLKSPEVLGEAASVDHKLVLPPDLQVLTPSGNVKLSTWDSLTPTTRVIDLGPRAIERFIEELDSAGTALFNGSPGALLPDHPLSSLNRLVSAFVQSKAIRVVVGGTGCSLFIREKLARQVDFIFPGGGAILAFLNGQASPAIPVLYENAQTAIAGAAPAYQPSYREGTS